MYKYSYGLAIVMPPTVKQTMKMIMHNKRGILNSFAFIKLNIKGFINASVIEIIIPLTMPEFSVSVTIRERIVKTGSIQNITFIIISPSFSPCLNSQ